MEDPIDLDFEFTENSMSLAQMNETTPSQANDIITITVETSNGELHTLNVQDNDDPFKVAFQFGSQHGLETEQVIALADYITQTRDQPSTFIQEASTTSQVGQPIELDNDQDLELGNDVTSSLHQPPSSLLQTSTAPSVVALPIELNVDQVIELVDNSDGSQQKRNTNATSSQSSRNVQPREFAKEMIRQTATSPRYKAPTLDLRKLHQKHLHSASSSAVKLLRRNNTASTPTPPTGTVDLDFRSQTARSTLFEPDPEFMPQITNKSRKIIAAKKQSGPVHERLYKKQKRTKNTISAPKPRPTTPSQMSFNHIMYQRQHKAKDKFHKSCQLKRKIQEEKELAECTGTPRINKKSRIRNAQSPIEDYLIKKGNERNAHVQARKKQLEDFESAQMSIKPQINTKSAHIARQKSKDYNSPRNLALYDLHKEKLEKQQKKAENSLKLSCTFQPSLLKRGKRSTTKQLMERLHSPKASTQEKLDQLRKDKERNDSEDMQTGQKFFKPKITRGPKTSREQTKSLFEHLHDIVPERRAREQDENLERAQIRLQQRAQEVTSPNIYEAFKTKQIIKIFELLDDDWDGMISSDQIWFGKVNEEVVHVVENIIKELPERILIDLELFESEFTRIFDKLPYNTRINILKRVPRTIQTEFIGSPKLTPKTIRLAASPREESIHKLRTAEVARSRSKEKEELEFFEEEEFKISQENTFQPNIEDPPTLIEEQPIESKRQPRNKVKKRGYIRLNLF